MLKKTKEGIGLLRRNVPALLWFELLYKLLGVTLFFPLLYGIFDFCMFITGYRYLTLENVRFFFRNPLVYLGILLMVLLLLLYAFLDISAVIYILHCSWCRKRTTAILAMRFAVRNLKAAWKKGNRRIFRLVLLTIPIYNAGQIPELFSTYSVPNLFLLPASSREAILLGMLAVYLLLLLPFLRKMYVFHYFTLEAVGYDEAVKKSKALGEKHHFSDAVIFLGFQAVCFLLYICLLFAAIFFIILFNRVFSGFSHLNQLYFSVVKIVMTVFILIFTLLGVPVSVICSSFLYYTRKGIAEEKTASLAQIHKARNCRISEREKALRTKYRKAVLLSEMAVFFITVSLCCFYIYRAHRGELKRNIEFLDNMEVTAHRGASRYYPENTMIAFQGALEAGADWIELDIHESRDRQIFVMHDRNFKRTTGKNANAWELTYDEIRTLDAGSFFDDEYRGEKIPLLSEVIDFAKEADIRLNIELKPAVQEAELEELLVSLLHEKDFVSRCVVTSQQYEALEKIKSLDEEITTVYVMGFAYGNINRLQAADNFSIRYSSITDSLVRRVHNAGRQIYAWTVNGRDAINLMTEKQVDNIITDNVYLARQCISTRANSDTLNDYIQFLNREIRLLSYRFRMNS